MKNPYHLCLKLKDRPCLVVGGGKVAERKVRDILHAGAEIMVVAPSATKRLKALAANGKITLYLREFKREDCRGKLLVFAATDDRLKNAYIANLSKRHRALVNVADSREESDFFVPANIRRGDLSIAVSTAGKVPALSKKIKNEIASQYGTEYAAYISLLDWGRKKIYRNQHIKPADKRRLVKSILNIDLPGLLESGRKREAKYKVDSILKVWMSKSKEKLDGKKVIGS